MVMFDPLVYPMDTAFIDGKASADHYWHMSPEYYRALEKAGLVELPAEPADCEDAQGSGDEGSSENSADKREEKN
jgi:hypothetical protein